jgi:hypothetical protein
VDDDDDDEDDWSWPLVCVFPSVLENKMECEHPSPISHQAPFIRLVPLKTTSSTHQGFDTLPQRHGPCRAVEASAAFGAATKGGTLKARMPNSTQQAWRSGFRAAILELPFLSVLSHGGRKQPPRRKQPDVATSNSCGDT